MLKKIIFNYKLGETLIKWIGTALFIAVVLGLGGLGDKPETPPTSTSSRG